MSALGTARRGGSRTTTSPCEGVGGWGGPPVVGVGGGGGGRGDGGGAAGVGRRGLLVARMRPSSPPRCRARPRGPDRGSGIRRGGRPARTFGSPRWGGGCGRRQRFPRRPRGIHRGRGDRSEGMLQEDTARSGLRPGRRVRGRGDGPESDGSHTRGTQSGRGGKTTESTRGEGSKRHGRGTCGQIAVSEARNTRLYPVSARARPAAGPNVRALERAGRGAGCGLAVPRGFRGRAALLRGRGASGTWA